MKNRILILAAVLSLVGVMFAPMAALAADTGTASVNGTVVAATIDVVAPTFAGFGTFSAGVNNIASTDDGTVTVTKNSQNPSGWTVTAKDLTNGGYMRVGDPSSQWLTSPLYISPNNWSSYATADVGASWTNTGTMPTWLSQTIANNEAAGTYSITLTYTGSLTF